MTTYQLSNIKQLIDLNGDLTNFNLEFDVKATNGETFEALVVTQETLDTNQSLSYQEAKGSISGSINSDKGIYQNYFLILRADKPTEVIVTLNIEPLGDLTVSALDETNQIHQQHMQQQHMTTSSNNKKKSWFVRNRIYIFIFFASVCLLVGLYFLLKDSSFFTDKIVSSISSKVDEKINGGFKQLNDSIDGINTGISSKLVEINGLNSKMDGIASEISGLKGGINDSMKNDTFLTKMDGIASEIKGGLTETLNTKIDGLSSKINDNLKLPEDFGHIKESLNTLKEQMDGLSLAPAVQSVPVLEPKLSSADNIFQKVKNLSL